MQKKVGIIIINYKDYAQRFLKDCRDSLRQQTYSPGLIQVYIIDNASTADSKKYLRLEFPESIIISRKDGNYTAANNTGLKKAMKDGCELLVIANMDVLFTKDWLKELVSAVEADIQIGAAQSKMLLYKGNKSESKPKVINSLGNIIHYLGFGFTDGYNQPDRKISGLPEIGYASGCSLIIKKEALERVGGYNEELYMYHDDVSLGWKLKLAGYKTVLAPKSVLYHKYNFDRSIAMLYFMERNRYICIFSYYKCATIMLILPALAVLNLGMLCYAITNKWFKVYLRVHWYFLLPSSWKKIMANRRNARKLRQVKDKDIVKDFVGAVKFQEIDNPVLKYIGNPILNVYWWVVRKFIFW